MGNQYNAPIIGTSYTIQVLKALLTDEKIKLSNKLKSLTPNSMIKISDNITIELIHVTHSTPQSAVVAVHTPHGIIVYANDFKFDNHPVLGNKPNYKRFKELGKNGVLALIVESLYCERESKTPSEEIAKQMLKEVMLHTDNTGKAVFVTTFASHLARIKSIIEFSKQLGRKVVILGRSMGRYIQAGEDLKLINFSKSAKMGIYKSQARKILEEVQKNREKYVVICTGNQAEPHSVLDRIVSREFKFQFNAGDHVIFSCRTIPAEMNVANREALEAKLKNQSVRFFKDIHVSGHSSKEDLRDFINMLKPKNIIPAHGENRMKKNFLALAEEEGYDISKNVFLLNDSQKITIE
jgi:ribonuclease J